MSSEEKAYVVERMEIIARGKRLALSELGIPRSTYYRWRRGLTKPCGRKSWNRITPNEDRRILAVAREFPDLSSRQLSARRVFDLDHR